MAFFLYFIDGKWPFGEAHRRLCGFDVALVWSNQQLGT